MRRDVTLVAGQSRVLSFKNVSSFFVVKSLDVPLHEREVQTIVLRVTAGTLLTRSGRDVVRSVQPFVSGQTTGNLSVTVQALQRSLPTEFMAASTIRSSIEELVGPGERARRDLGRSSNDPAKAKPQQDRQRRKLKRALRGSLHPLCFRIQGRSTL